MSGKQKKRERATLKEREIFLEKEARLGNSDAQVSLGYTYCERSALGPMDLTMAFYWLKLAADQGHAEGLMSIASFYLYGIGIEKNIKFSAKYLYAYHKKIDSDLYRSWVDNGFDEEYIIEQIYCQNNMQDTLARKFKEEAGVNLFPFRSRFDNLNSGPR